MLIEVKEEEEMTVRVPEPPEPEDGQDQEARVVAQPLLQRASMELPLAPWDAEAAVRRAQADLTNDPGYCLQVTRGWAGIDARYKTAAIAAANVIDMHRDRDFPPGAFLWWVGGRLGYGHVAMGEPQRIVRSTDAGGSGRVASRSLAWFDQNWPSLTYVGWSDNCNGYRLPGVMKEWDEMATKAEIQEALQEVVNDPAFIKKVGDEVWRREFRATNARGVEVQKPAREFLTESWELDKVLAKGGE